MNIGNNINMNSPCRECKDRVLHCHSTCERYKEYKDKITDAKNKIKSIEKQNKLANNYSKTAVSRMKKYRCSNGIMKSGK